MDELKLNYSKKGKHSKKTKQLLMYAGIIMVLLSLLTMILVISQDFKIVLLIASIANTLVGISFILSSLDHKIMFPDKFFFITDEAIEYKLGGFFKEQKIEWDSISRISDEGKSIHIYSGEKVIKINMLHFPSSDEKRIKACLNTIVEQKNGPPIPAEDKGGPIGD